MEFLLIQEFTGTRNFVQGENYFYMYLLLSSIFFSFFYLFFFLFREIYFFFPKFLEYRNA